MIALIHQLTHRLQGGIDLRPDADRASGVYLLAQHHSRLLDRNVELIALDDAVGGGQQIVRSSDDTADHECGQQHERQALRTPGSQRR